MNTQCLNNPTVYPADPNAGGTDTPCGGSNQPSYGDLLHLFMSPAQIASSSHLGECKAILTAMANYVAFLFDTGDMVTSLLAESALTFASSSHPDPWASLLVPHLKAAGETTGQYWNWCLSGLSEGDFELLQIAPGSF